MARNKEYKLTNVEFKGQALVRLNRVVKYHSKGLKSSPSGMISVPARFVGQTFDVYLIPVNFQKNGENQENNQEITKKD